MVMGMATTAMAADEKIIINNAMPDHKYEAYQVFSGTLSSDGILSDVQWGAGVNGPALLQALKDSDKFLKGEVGSQVNQFDGCATASAVATVISSWGYNDNAVKNFADVVSANLNEAGKKESGSLSGGKYTIALGDAAGYYFIKDVQGLSGSDAATDYLLYVTGSAEISPKVSAPTFTKSVNYEKENTYHAAIDAQVGDTVYFKLETKLPSLYKDYKQYHIIMEDTLPAGLTFNRVEDIYIAHSAGGHTSSYLSQYSNLNDNPLTAEQLANPKNYSYDSASHKLTVNFGDLRKSQTDPNLNDTYVVKYSAIVNKNAVLGKGSGKGNENKAMMKFSNDMNQVTPADLDELKLGSLESSASVYVYQLEVTKQDSQTKEKLSGAQFNLYRNMETSSGTVPYYAVVDTIYVRDDGTTQTTANPEKDVHCIYNITKWVTMEEKLGNDNIDLYSGKDGTFIITGLDYVNYHLKEVKAPERYNTLADPVLITITSTITGQNLTDLTGAADGVSGTGDVTNGKVSVAVNNTLGNTLPETGGIGTTIFYIVGGVLVLGAGAAFVMKRRNEEA